MLTPEVTPDVPKALPTPEVTVTPVADKQQESERIKGTFYNQLAFQILLTYAMWKIQWN